MNNQQNNYDSLRKVFRIIPSSDPFIIYNEEILTEEFIKNFNTEKNNRVDTNFKISYDPAVVSLLELSITTKLEKIIQNTLVEINKLYGSKGLEQIRSINLANGLSLNKHFIRLPIANNDAFYQIVDLDYLLSIDYNNQELYDLSGIYNLYLDKSEFNPLKRTIDILNCSMFINYPNENVKSALFSIPHLLYDSNQELHNEEYIYNLLELINSKMSNKHPLLESKLLYEATIVCHNIYLLELFNSKTITNSKRLTRKTKYYEIT